VSTFEERIMKNLFKTMALISLYIFGQNSYGNMGPQMKITCETPRGTKVLVIEDQKVSISQPFRIDQTRSVASVQGVRTKLEGTGFTKVMFHNGAKHIIHIEDRKSFSVVDDYLIIRSNEGHEMTYPLECN
jgi:hypothetical protein